MTFHPRTRTLVFTASLAAAAVLSIGCGPGNTDKMAPAVEAPAAEPSSETSAERAHACIGAVLAQDNALGTARNHAPETAPLAQAIRDYLAGLEAIDFVGCPEDFTTAFQRHREAWAASEKFFEGFAKLRGEMHDLFDAIRGQGGETQDRLEELEAGIWGTWAEVETAARAHGAMEPAPPEGGGASADPANAGSAADGHPPR